MIGISIKPTIGIGDALQYSSLPENYFRTLGKKLIDVNKPWFFDHNPYVIRDERPTKTVEMWNFSPTQWEWPNPRKDKPHVYLSNAEIWAAVHNVKVFLNRPRLYQFESYPFEQRRYILLQTNGVSHGEMPQHIINHVVRKYSPTSQLYQIGDKTARKIIGIEKLETPTLWSLAELISKCRMLICMDSAPAWIGACYPDVIVKKIRTKPNPPELFEEWVPLEIRNIHSHWDDRCHMIYNVTDRDIGFTSAYTKI